MRLQAALDVTSADAALVLAAAIAPHVDLFELGPTLIKREGMAVVRALKAAHPAIPVVADAMIADKGEREAALAVEAGADLVTVLGSASDVTVVAAVAAAKARGAGVVVDLLGVPDPVARAKRVRALGARFVTFHAGVDARADAAGQAHLGALLNAGEHARVPFLVAGGVTRESIPAIQRAGADIVVAGAAIHAAADPAEAARRLKAAIF